MTVVADVWGFSRFQTPMQIAMMWAKTTKPTYATPIQWETPSTTCPRRLVNARMTSSPPRLCVSLEHRILGDYRVEEMSWLLVPASPDNLDNLILYSSRRRVPRQPQLKMLTLNFKKGVSTKFALQGVQADSKRGRKPAH